MNKTTIEIERKTDHILGYGRYDGPTEEECLDKLIEWTNLPENKNKKIYKHYLKAKEENISTIKFYDYDSINKIPYCDIVYYLQFYWQ